MTAAGNEGNRLSEIPTNPAAFRIPSQLVVGASQGNGSLYGFSNYDTSLVHLVAPGEATSAYNESDSSYRSFSGTSMAAPLVAGSLALLMESEPNRSTSWYINRLLNAVELRFGLAESSLSKGRLNINRALLGLTNIPVNDAFSNATTIEGASGEDSGTTALATSEEVEQVVAGAAGNTVWYRWSPPRDSELRLIYSPLGFRGVV